MNPALFPKPIIFSSKKGGKVSTREMSSDWEFAPRGRTLNNVQRVVRTLIWLGLFAVLAIVTVIVTLVLSAVHPVLGIAALVSVGSSA
jgi:hypothetical protein